MPFDRSKRPVKITDGYGILNEGRQFLIRADILAYTHRHRHKKNSWSSAAYGGGGRCCRLEAGNASSRRWRWSLRRAEWLI